MDLTNKTFKDNRTGEVIKVISNFENIVILENKQKIDTKHLLNPILFNEQNTAVKYSYSDNIDPNDFFNNQNTYNLLAEKIKSIPPDKIYDDPEIRNGEISVKMENNNNGFNPSMEESAVIMSNEDDERAELARKYGVQDINDQIEKQNSAFSRFFNDDDGGEVQKIEINNDDPYRPMIIEKTNDNDIRPVQYSKAPIQEDPITAMFKNVKRNIEFSISLEIKNKIPRPDFIEMMEDSYNTSIIDFLASEFTDNILRNPQMIENMIKQKIKEIVYGEEVAKEVVVKETKTPRVKKVPVEGEVKPKPRKIKSTEEK